MRIIAVGSGVLLVVLAIFLARPAPVADLDNKVCDLLSGWAGRGETSGRVVIVEIDEKSLAQFGRWPWPRDLMGRITGSVLDHGASAVVLDMMFPEEDRSTTRATGGFAGTPGGSNDELLAKALSGKSAVLGYSLNFDRDTRGMPACN